MRAHSIAGHSRVKPAVPSKTEMKGALSTIATKVPELSDMAIKVRGYRSDKLMAKATRELIVKALKHDGFSDLERRELSDMASTFEDENLANMLRVLLSNEQWEALEEWAEEARVGKSEFVRLAVFGSDRGVGEKPKLKP